MKRLLGFICSLLLSLHSLMAQSDTIIVEEPIQHSPKKATFMSMVVPGLGQAYNKKYWKIPIVYAAIGTSLYFAIENAEKFEDFKSAYAARVDDDATTTDDKYLGIYTDENLLSLIDINRKNRDLMYVLTAFSYILNVVDAAVDAHLYYFDVSDDLSAKIKPSLQLDPINSGIYPGMTVSLKFGKKHHLNYQ